MPVVAERSVGQYTLSAFVPRNSTEPWSVDAYVGSPARVIGTAAFVPIYGNSDGRRELRALKGWNVFVRPEHRRRGVASAMYRFAQEAFGLPIRRGDVQTDEGAAFLRSRRNPARAR